MNGERGGAREEGAQRRRALERSDQGDSEERLLERCEAYLEGALSSAETRRFERELTLEQNAAVFRQVLLMRQLLAELPPDAAPEDLVARIEVKLLGAVAADAGEENKRKKAQRGAGLNQLGVALWGTSWALRGPAMALSASAAGGGGQPARSGLGTLRYAAGPLAVRPAQERPERPKKPLWQRLLGVGRAARPLVRPVLEGPGKKPLWRRLLRV